MTTITLTTDFGSGDQGAGVLSGIIWSIAPKVHIADLSHDITRHDILEAALLLQRAAPYFAAGTIHMAVVDPGVGTPRRGIAARVGEQYFVGPDNGLVSLILARAEQNKQPSSFVQLDRPGFWMSEVSSIFHGRDIFAPVAGHLAAGTPLQDIGTPINDPLRIEIPEPIRTSTGWIGQVIHVDHFGNLATNLKVYHMNQMKEVMILFKDMRITSLASTFGEQPKGTLIAMVNSNNSLAISVVNGSAAQTLQAAEGDKVELIGR